jgi:hypothetical protein
VPGVEAGVKAVLFGKKEPKNFGSPCGGGVVERPYISKGEVFCFFVFKQRRLSCLKGATR